MGRKRIDITGQRFGRLTTIEFFHINKWGNPYWLCACNCGNEKIFRGADLKNGATKSCGCLRKEQLQLPEGVAARNSVIEILKRNAKRRNLEQDLTDEQILAIHKENCHYCGAPPSNVCFQPQYNGSYTYNGIDRMDNDKGYTLANSVSSCKDCNFSKGTKSYEEFINWLKRVCSYLNLCHEKQ